jgi:hypothetical protein
VAISYGVPTHDDEIHFAGVGQRAGHAGEELGRAQVDEVVQAEAQLKQHLAFNDAGGNAGVPRGRTDGAEQNGVVAPQFVQRVLRQGLPRGQPVLGTELVLRQFKGGVFVGGRRLENLDAFGHHLRTDSVSGDDCQ